MNHDRAVTALGALAQTHRLAIFRLLVCEGPAGMAATDIANTLHIRPTSLSFHVKELEHAGLVTATRHGRSIRYAVNVSGMRELLGFLADDCCQGRPELCGAALCDPSAEATSADTENDFTENSLDKPFGAKEA